MLTLIQSIVVAIAIGNAEGNLNQLKPADSYMGHTDPCVAAGTCPGRKPNRGIFSIASDSYSAQLETKYFLDLISKLNSINANYKFTFWFILNVADLYVQSPQATTGWNDAKSQGVGLLERLAKLNPDITTDTIMAKTRAQAFVNTNGATEAWTNQEGLYKDQLRRVNRLREIYNEYTH
jgi:hypothetical protein